MGDALSPIVTGLLVAAVECARMLQVMAAIALIMAIAVAVPSKRIVAERLSHPV